MTAADAVDESQSSYRHNQLVFKRRIENQSVKVFDRTALRQ